MNAKAVVRYMTHIDNPEKYQYKKFELVSHGGADIAELLKPTSSDRYELIKEKIMFIRENEIRKMKDLLNYANEKRFDDWFPLLSDNSAYIIGQYIKLNRYGYSK